MTTTEQERHARELAREAAEARAAVAPIGDADLDVVLALVRHVDRRHDAHVDHCGACETLRGVRDDVLRAARAQALAERVAQR